MNKNGENTLCEYSEEESAFIKGAFSSNGETEGAKRFRMELRAKEYELCDFSMYTDFLDDDTDSADAYMQDREPDQMTGAEIIAKAFAEAEHSPASEEYTMTADAYMVNDEGLVELSYTESLDGETEQLCRIYFETDSPGLVTVCKTGMASAVLTVEEGVRHSCVYRTPYMDFEMRIFGMRVDNTVGDNGGVIRLDYALEIRGAAAHRTVMELKLTEE